MFSPFVPSTQSSTLAASNPFAPKARTNPFVTQDDAAPSAFGAKPAAGNPFAQNTSTSSTVNGAPNPFAPTPTFTPADIGKDDKQTSKAPWGTQSNDAPNPFASAQSATASGFGKDDSQPSKAPWGRQSNGAPNSFAATESVTAASFGKHDNQPSKTPWGQQPNGTKPSFGQSGGQGGAFTESAGKVKSATAQFFQPKSIETEELPNSNDPHAKKVYEQLRKDGIRPPAWPSQPGAPNHKAQMAKFREQYEEYRSKVRASLTRAGLIDDPSKRRTLQDAIDFKGICEDMCPEYEKITRITELDIPSPEKDPQSTFASTTRMVKKLARSAAGQEAPLPMDVLSVPTLRRTLNYLIDDLLRDDENLPTLHGYLWDRTRAIRRDFSFFSSLTTEEIKIQASVLEDIARFHVTALHLLSQSGKAPEDFVEQQELEQLGKALLTLRDIYDDCSSQGSPCENEAEFRAYYLLFHANDPNIIETVQRQWRPSLWRDSDVIRTAVSLVEALHNTSDFHGPLQDGPSLAASGAHTVYFRIVEDPKVSYTMACFAECHFPQLRRSILRNVKKALARPKETSHDVSASDLNKFLRFDTIEQAIEFSELHDLEFQPNPVNPTDRNLSFVVLHGRIHLPHHRLQHQFSQRFVESKRGSQSLPRIIHDTVYADSTALSQKRPSLMNEGSLFVPQSAKVPSYMPPPPQKTAFGGFGQPMANGPTIGNPVAKASFAPTQQPTKPSFFPPTTTLTPTAQPTAPAFGANNSENPASVLGFGGAKQPSNPFASVLPAKTEDAPTGKPATESSPFKTAFGAGTPLTGLATSATPGTASLLGNTGAAPPTFGFIPSKAEQPLAMAPSTTPQKPLSAFSGFPPQSHTEKALEAPKSSTPPGSPTRTSPFTQAPKLNPPTQPGPSVSASGLTFTPSAFPSTSKPALSLGGVAKQPVAAAPVAAAAVAPPAPPPKPPQPKRDRLLDFTKWFVEGDEGLMAEFQQHFLEGLVMPVFVDWQQKAEEKRIREEEARDNAAADEFRQRSLSLRYFYRWKTNAREKRLKFLRRSGREQLKNFYRAQQTATRIPQATPKPKPDLPAIPRPHREQALMESLRQSQAKRRYAPPPTFSSSLDINKARDSAAAIGRHFNLPMSQSDASSPTRSRSSSMSKGGSKTRALREELLGKSTGRFRRSLPSIASSEESGPESVRSSKVSERWRLKAMGIVQLPDGTAVPESLLNDRRFNAYSRSQRASSITSAHSRRPSISSIPPPPPFSPTNYGTSSGILEDGTSNKRKRTSEDSIGLMGQEDGPSSANNHKRVMSDAENLVRELRALREEMEEGTMWFKSQNDRLHNQIVSRGGTPMDDSI